MPKVIPNEKRVILLALNRAQGVYYAHKMFPGGSQRERWLNGQVRVVSDIQDLLGTERSSDLVAMRVGQFDISPQAAAIEEYLENRGIEVEQGPIG